MYENTLAPALQEDIDSGASPWMVTDPDRFDEDDLVEREASMGRSNFMLQFMLDTSLSDAEKFPLKISDLIVTSVNPTHAPDNIIWSNDPANVIKDISYVGLPGDYAYGPVQSRGDWDTYTQRQSARLIRRVEDRMRRQQLISPNETVYCTCTKCELIRMDILTEPF